MYSIKNSRLSKALLIVISSLSVFCTPQMDDKNKTAAVEGLKSHEIKQVPDADIVATAYERGEIIANLADDLFLEKLQSESVEACEFIPDAKLDSVVSEYGAKLQMLNPDHPGDDEIELQILEAYKYSLANGQEIAHNVQEIDDNLLLYSRAIITTAELCRKCLNSSGNSEDADDTSNGDILCGMWSIMLSKKEIVKSL